jgi:hypothetical protein
MCNENRKKHSYPGKTAAIPLGEGFEKARQGRFFFYKVRAVEMA